MSSPQGVLIAGAGPAGLAAAYELARCGRSALVLEQDSKVGGISRTESYKGYRFDIGGHRFYTKSREVQHLWRQMLGEDFRTVRRLSRIYYQGRFFKYPLNLSDTLGNLGAVESSLILLSYLKARLWPQRREETFEQWVTNRFGARLFRTFFQTYTEKVWGIPCGQIRSDWAAQRIGSLSVPRAIRSALFGDDGMRTLINEFQYPLLGPGMMWERLERELTALGGQVIRRARVVRLDRQGRRIRAALVEQDGRRNQMEAEQFISSMPLADLIHRLNPAPPTEVLRAAAGLKYRAFVMAAIIVARRDLFPDNWIYVHCPSVKVGRIQNFKNWSPAMVADPACTCLGMEYFCNEGDELWKMPDGRLLELAAGELEALGLASRGEVRDGAVIRQAAAYPVYDMQYQANLRVIRGFLEGVENLQTVGRNGMHRYNNQDHSMLTGLLAARNLLGQRHDLWSVNADRNYGESQAAGETAIPCEARASSF